MKRVRKAADLKESILRWPSYRRINPLIAWSFLFVQEVYTSVMLLCISDKESTMKTNATILVLLASFLLSANAW